MVAHLYRRLPRQRTLFLEHQREEREEREKERQKQKLQAALKQKIAEKAAAAAEAKAVAKAEAEAAAAEAAAAEAAAAEKAAAKKTAAAEKAATDKYILWLFNTRAGRDIFSTLPKKEQSSLLKQYKKARAAAALREKASREPLTHVRTTQRKCTYCFEPIMIGKRTDNTNAFWCQKHCGKTKK